MCAHEHARARAHAQARVCVRVNAWACASALFRVWLRVCAASEGDSNGKRNDTARDRRDKGQRVNRAVKSLDGWWPQ
eukprot:6204962-Pleurochrysis_carterae.AAC.2